MKHRLIPLIIVLALIISACSEVDKAFTFTDSLFAQPTSTPIPSPTPFQPVPETIAHDLVNQELVIYNGYPDIPIEGDTALLKLIVTDRFQGKPMEFNGLSIEDEPIQASDIKSVVMFFDADLAGQEFFRHWFNDPYGDRVEPLVENCDPIVIQRPAPFSGYWHYAWNRVGENNWLVEYYYDCR
jgi:hypothetical protein